MAFMVNLVSFSLYYDHFDMNAVRKPKKMDTQETTEQWVSVDQVALHLNVKPDTVYKWLERKNIPAHKVGRLWRFKISEIDAWVRSGKASGDEVKYE